MEAKHLNYQQSKNREKLMLSTGIFAIMASVPLLFVACVCIFDSETSANTFKDAFLVDYGGSLKQLDILFIIAGILILAASVLTLIAGYKFIRKYSKVTSREEFKKIGTEYITWTIILFLLGGPLVDVFIILALCSSNSETVQQTLQPEVANNIDILKSIRDKGLITDEEYARLVIAIARKT